MLPMILGLSLSGLVILALSPAKQPPSSPDEEIVIIRKVKSASWSDQS